MGKKTLADNDPRDRQIEEMDSEPSRAAAFANHLLSNSSLNALNVLQKEEQVLQFLNANSRTLLPTLSSSRFFPGKRWNEILDLLYSALIQETDKHLVPQLEELLKAKLSFSFVSAIQPRSVPEEGCREETWELIGRILHKPEARKAMSGPFTAIKYSFPDRYLDRSLAARQYVHFELTKVQRLRLEVEEIKHMVAVTLLLRPLIQLLTVGRSGGELAATGTVKAPFAQTAFESIKTQLTMLPLVLVRSALFSNVSFLEDKHIDATARIASIFSARARNYKPVGRVDRGADTPDRSWLSIARRNYKYYGFDIKMLDEFYNIASESGW